MSDLRQRTDGISDCQFAVWRTLLAEFMPHLLSFGALSPRNGSDPPRSSRARPTASDGITPNVASQ